MDIIHFFRSRVLLEFSVSGIHIAHLHTIFLIVYYPLRFKIYWVYLRYFKAKVYCTPVFFPLHLPTHKVLISDSDIVWVLWILKFWRISFHIEYVYRIFALYCFFSQQSRCYYSFFLISVLSMRSSMLSWSFLVLNNYSLW